MPDLRFPYPTSQPAIGRVKRDWCGRTRWLARRYALPSPALNSCLEPDPARSSSECRPTSCSCKIPTIQESLTPTIATSKASSEPGSPFFCFSRPDCLEVLRMVVKVARHFFVIGFREELPSRSNSPKITSISGHDEDWYAGQEVLMLLRSRGSMPTRAPEAWIFAKCSQGRSQTSMPRNTIGSPG